MALMWATSITRAIGRRGALKIKTFLGPEMATSESSAILSLLIKHHPGILRSSNNIPNIPL